MSHPPTPSERARLRQLALAAATIGDGVCVTDPDGRIEFVNSALEDMLGYDRGELLGRPVSDLYPGGASDPILQEIMAGLLTGGWSGEAGLLAKGGDVVSTQETATPMRDEDGELVGHVCINMDITERKQAERALQESEERYRAVVESVTDAISINVEGKRAFVNDAFVKLFGLKTREEALGIDVEEFIHSDDAARARERLAAVDRGEVISTLIDVRIERPDGEVRTAEVAATSFVYGGKPARLAVMRDVTESRRAERERYARSEELQAIFNIASVLSGPGTFSNQVTAVLEELIRLLDVESADLRVPGGQNEGLVVVTSVGSARQALGTFRAYDDSRTGRAFRTGEPVISHAFAAHHRGGAGRGRRERSGYVPESVAWIPVKAAGEIVGVVAVDTSKPDHFTAQRTRLLVAIVDGMGPFLEAAKLREEAQQHVREVEGGIEQLQAVLNVASIFAESGPLNQRVELVLQELLTVVQADSAHLRVPDEKESGLRLVASAGRGVREIVPDDVRPLEGSRSGDVFQHGEPIIANDYATNRTPGRTRGRAQDAYGAQSAAWLPVKAGGRTIGVVTANSSNADHFTAERVRLLTAIVDGIGTFLENANLREAAQRHVHELETTLAQLQATQQQLIQSEKLAAVGTLIAGVAHELNNPLSNILGRVQLLQRAISDDAAEQGLQTVRDECDRAIRIVRNLLLFTREHKPETTLVSVNDTLDEVLELRAYELRVSNIELRKDFQADLPEISADPHQLQQVFLNLVINAEQAMTAAHDRGVLSIRTQRVRDVLYVTVADDGPGIPNELVSKIFDPFFTTKEVGAGTGLGLSVCYGIVKEHGGELHVKSEEGKGTTFTIELPLQPQG